jgi:hypothetical protein
MAYARTKADFGRFLTILWILLGVVVADSEVAQYCELCAWFPVCLRFQFPECNDGLSKFASYFGKCWIRGAVALPVVWSYYGRANLAVTADTTNNDAERSNRQVPRS